MFAYCRSWPACLRCNEIVSRRNGADHPLSSLESNGNRIAIFVKVIGIHDAKACGLYRSSKLRIRRCQDVLACMLQMSLDAKAA